MGKTVIIIGNNKNSSGSSGTFSEGSFRSMLSEFNKSCSFHSVRESGN